MTEPDPTNVPDGIESSSYNTPVDDPHHYDFSNADVPIRPDERTPASHGQHVGGYVLNEEVDVVAAVAPKKDSDIVDATGDHDHQG